MKPVMIAAAFALAALAAPAAGEKFPVFVEAAPVKDAPAVSLDSAKGYVMLRSDLPVPLYLMRIPSAEDQKEYDKLRADALAKAIRKYPGRVKSYHDRVAAAKATGSTYRGGEMPVEPTEENFSYTAFGMLAQVAIGPLNRFAKVKGGASTYLTQITPGRYFIYGPVMITSAGPVGNCFCMGTVSFEVRPGEITDLGVILAKQAFVTTPPKEDSSMPMLVKIPDFLGPAPADMTVDPRLAGFAITRAAYRPYGKVPNFFGGAIDRIPEMPGILRYEGDTIVDLTAGS